MHLASIVWCIRVVGPVVTSVCVWVLLTPADAAGWVEDTHITVGNISPNTL